MLMDDGRQRPAKVHNWKEEKCAPEGPECIVYPDECPGYITFKVGISARQDRKRDIGQEGSKD